MTGWRSARAHKWSPVRHAWRSSVRHRRSQALALVAVSALVTACTVFAPLYDRAMQEALVDTLLQRTTPAERTVSLVSSSGAYAGGTSDSRAPAEIEGLLDDEVLAHLGPVVYGRTAIVTPTTGAVPPSGLLMWRDGACDYVRVLSGACPQARGEIMVSEADAANFDLRPGARLKIPTVYDDDFVRLEVVGTYAPLDDPWWQGQRTVGISGIVLGLDPSANHDAWLTTEQTFLDAQLLDAESSQAGAPVADTSSDIESMLALDEGIRSLEAGLELRGVDLQIDTGITELVDSVRTQVRQAHRTVPLLLAPMAVLSLFVLWLVLSSATAQRRGEVAVARLRGRGPAAAAGLLLLELLPPLLVGVLPGALAAVAGAAVVADRLPGSAPFELGDAFGVALLVAVSAIVLTTVVAAVRTAREPLHDVVRSGAVPSTGWALGAVDAFVVAAVGSGVLAFATGSLQGPLALAGPALLALLTGLLLGHLAAPAGRVVGRHLLRRGRPVAGSSMLEVGRRREGRAMIAVITVACALAVFSLDARAVGERNRVSASRHDAGAPVVLELDGRDLDGVRSALAAADPTGLRATPVLVARGDTLAVEPEAFRRISFFPRGAPTPAEWRAIAPPDREPVVITGTRIALDVRPSGGLGSTDLFGSTTAVRLGVAVTSATGVLRTVDLGRVPARGVTRTLTARLDDCARGCRLAALQLTTLRGAIIEGDLDLSDLRVDGRAVDLGTAPTDWNPVADDDFGLVVPVDGPDQALRLEIATRGDYPVEVTPAWVPSTVPALMTAELADDEDLSVTAVDGSQRSAEDVGRLVLVPSLDRIAALADLDAVTRGATISNDSRLEVWLADDPALVAAVRTNLQEREILVGGTRRYTTIRRGYEESVASWSLALGAAVAPAVGLLALLVLLVLAVIGWRTRARDLAVLGLAGVRRRTTLRLATWAQVPAVLLAVVGGVLAGLGGAVLAMPDVAFFPAPPEVPVVDTSTAWPTVFVVAAVCLLLLLSAAAVAGVAVHRRAHLERVKDGT